MTPTILDLSVVYGPDRIGYAFREPNKRYSKGYHRGTDIREQAGVWPNNWSVITDVAALHAGEVVFVGWAPGGMLGYVIVIRFVQGKTTWYETHAHNDRNTITVKSGDDVTAGQKLARNAAAGNGSGPITGPHDHVTITRHSDGAWITRRAEYDPVPFIRRAIATQRAEQTKPPVTTPDIGDDDMTQTIRVDKAHYFSVAPEFISHHSPKDQSDLTRKVMSVKDEQHELSSKDFLMLLDGLGIPRSVVEVEAGKVQGVVLNPETGQKVKNGVWSRNRQVYALLTAKTPAGK